MNSRSVSKHTLFGVITHINIVSVRYIAFFCVLIWWLIRHSTVSANRREFFFWRVFRVFPLLKRMQLMFKQLSKSSPSWRL